MNIPGFEILKTIGRGGMATVYLARQESLGREVVLKTISIADNEGKDFSDRFLNEARIIASLRHPHIITIFDVGSTSDLMYLSMEYVGGGDLKARMEQPMPPHQALAILERVGEALHFAHQQGVIHRDVKPANILFQTDGTPLLSDFGIAKRVTVDQELTSTGTILGSPFYMSPEQAEGLVVDGRTDIYSLGIIFYEMLTGARPYQGDSAIKVIMQHLQSPMPKLAKNLESYQSLLAKMVAKDRDERFADGAAMVEGVREALAATSTKARRENTGAHAALRPSGVPAELVAVRAPRLSTTTRILLLLGCLFATGAGFGAFYAYVQKMSNPLVVQVMPLPAGYAAGPAQAEAGTPAFTNDVAAAQVSAEHTPEALRKDVVRALEWLARKSLREDRLTEPPADNAHYYYSRLVALDPDNEYAQRGFSEIAERFVVLAEQQFAQHNFKKAQAYVTLGLQVEPNNDGLLALQSMMDNREKSLLDSLLELVRGNG